MTAIADAVECDANPAEGCGHGSHKCDVTSRVNCNESPPAVGQGKRALLLHASLAGVSGAWHPHNVYSTPAYLDSRMTVYI